ncbi:MAG TPA: enoyl-CoA hydratase-related protein [Pseudonocardiaceae bacterium]|jgi:polyketide biosynthesis enoyl-CoA hydratase PksH
MLSVEPGAITRIRLDRPSISDAVLTELHGALDAVERNAECRVVVIEGADAVFCAGMDFADDAATSDADSAREFFRLLRRLTETPHTVLAKVVGRASGGGVGLAAACDVVVAGPEAVFGLPELLWGLLPCCVLPFLIRRVGFQTAYAMTVTTQPVTAEQAKLSRLVDEVSADPEQVIRRIAFRSLRLTESAVREAKRYCASLAPITPDVEDRAVAELARLLGTSEVRAAMGAFAQRQQFPWHRAAR